MGISVPEDRHQGGGWIQIGTTQLERIVIRISVVVVIVIVIVIVSIIIEFTGLLQQIQCRIHIRNIVDGILRLSIHKQ